MLAAVDCGRVQLLRAGRDEAAGVPVCDEMVHAEEFDTDSDPDVRQLA